METIHTIGRRKTSVARVTLTPGKGTIIINGKDINDYFPYATLVQDATQGFVITKTENQFMKANDVVDTPELTRIKKLAGLL